MSSLYKIQRPPRQPEGDTILALTAPLGLNDDQDLMGECLYCRMVDRYYTFGRMTLGWFVPLMEDDPLTGERRPVYRMRVNPLTGLEERRRAFIPRTVTGLGCPTCMASYNAEIIRGRKFWKIG